MHLIPRTTFTGLWRNADFVRLWASETVSQFGTQVSMIALPLTAVLELDASAGQMGILSAAATLPFLLFGLFAGVWVDRLRRRPILVITDILRALVLFVVPGVWALDVLTIEVLYAVAFTSGCLTLFFDVAWMSYLPSLVRRDQLTEGNSKLQGSASVAQVAGPGIAGVLVALVTAPFAIFVDAVSFLVSALFLGRIRTKEPAPERHADPNVLREIGEGLRVVLRSPILRALGFAAGTSTGFGHMFLVVYVLYMTRDLGFSAFQVGLVFGVGGVGAVIGSMLAIPAARRFGIGPTIVGSRVLVGAFGMLVPLAVLVPGVEVPMVVAAEFLQWMMLLVSDINSVSLRQGIVPQRLQGRMNATMRFLVAGTIPIGSLIGGMLGELVGLRATLVVGVGGMFIAALWVYFSPLRAIRVVPELLQDETPGPARSNEEMLARVGGV